jgi:release factor glutamine methyltransferase
MLQAEGAEALLYREALENLESVWSAMPDKPEETPESTIRALWFAAAGDPRSPVRCVDVALPNLNGDGASRFRQLVELRASGKPLAHLTGRQNFAGLEMISGPGALIPRRETELLASTAIDLLKTALLGKDDVLAIDVCTGSGNVALALAASDPRVTVIGADLSADALALARLNAERLDFTARVSFIASDLFVALESPTLARQASLVTCNPPYIASSKVSAMAAEISGHEPRLAFDGGAFGFTIISRLLADAPRFIRPGGSLCFEVGAGNGAFIADRARRNPAYSEVRSVTDVKGVVRVLVATVV